MGPHPGQWSALVLLLSVSGPTLASAEPFHLSDYLAEVRERSPALLAAQQREQAAVAGITVASALDDPILSYAIAPQSIGVADLDTGHIVGLAQPLPWPGKLRQRAALAGARADDAAGAQALSLQELLRDARLAYAHWQLLHTALDLNRQQQLRLQELEQSAAGQYRSGGGSQQLLLQAGLRRAQRQTQALRWQAQREGTRAQINALRNRPENTPLGAPQSVAVWPAMPPREELLAALREHHPVLRQLQARRAGARAQLRLARLQDAPDLRLTANYLGTLPREENRAQIGLSLNLPFGRAKRRAGQAAAHAEGEALASQQQEVQNQLESRLSASLAGERATLETLRLYRDSVLPLAEQNLAAATATYASGAGAAKALIDAADEWLEAQLQQAQARHQLWQQRAELAWLAGGALDTRIFPENAR